MERRNANSWIIAVLAIAVGFLAALLIFGGNDSTNSSATVATTATTAVGTTAPATTTTAAPATSTTTATATTQGTAPQSPQPTTASCMDLWNQANNRGDQTFLVNLEAHQPIRVHVGVTTDVPPECLITVVANNGDAYVFPEGGGNTFPYAPAPGATRASSLPVDQKIANALEQSDGTLKAR